MYSSIQEKRTWQEIGWIIIGIVAQAIILVMISAGLSFVIWKWIVPEVFQGAVRSNLLSETISFLQALKLSILFAILGLTVITSISIKVKSYDGVVEWLKVRAMALVVAIPLLILIAVISGLLLSLVWTWIVPDVFTGAVTLGFLPESLSVWHGILISTLLSVLSFTWILQNNISFKG